MMRIRGLWRLRQALYVVRNWLARLFAEQQPAGDDPTQLALAVRKMAETGIGTDECLKQKCLPMMVHFYSPVPDIEDLKARRIWSRRSSMAGIEMREDAQVALLSELGREFGHECDWPDESTGDNELFFTNNSGFSYGCAAATHMLIRKFNPRRVIEIGSGSSSRVIAAALRMNAGERVESAAQYTIVNPYPAEELKSLTGLTCLVPQRVELLNVSVFEELQENDILFVDSGHTVRIGGDVNFLILDVLPRLARGVIAHFHDIPMPYEYAEVYYTNPKFRMFWTESYLLQAFLSLNQSYEILLAMNYLMMDRMEGFRAVLPHYKPQIHKFPSHSFWIRRTR